MTLQDLRQQIDAIDQELVTLLGKRADLVLHVAKVKGEGVKFSPAREAQVINKVIAANKGAYDDKVIAAVFREIISGSLSLEHPLTVSYLGPAGTYSEEAALTRFGAMATLLPCLNLDEAIKAAEKGETQLAVLPIENSTEGTVSRTLDLLLQTQLKIVDEIALPIHHQLLTQAKTLADVSEIAAHPQALAQCRAWLAAHLPHAKQTATNSNAEAAVAAAKHPHMAAIASERAAHTYKLPILMANIEDDSSNTTMFVVVGNVQTHTTGKDKTSLICSVPNKPGGLGKLVTILSDAGLNMTKLESRPSPSGLWDYVFYIDIDGHTDDKPVASALKKLQDVTLFVKVAGSYPKVVI